ncbi:MAG: SdpI family protein [Oscillospiraceae bacterium]|nr:SdpI family protein [Oscillospiraceae bacterium]
MKKMNITLCILTLINLAVSFFVILRTMPDTVPTHFNAEFVCDGVGSKWGAIVLPAIACIMALLTPLVIKTSKQSDDALPKKINAFISLFIAAIGWIMLFMMKQNVTLGERINGSWYPAMLLLTIAAVFICIGNYMPVVEQNNVLGLKIKWTLENAVCWKRTHRIAGKIMVGSGLIMILLTALSMLLHWNMVLSLCLSMTILTADIVAICFYAYLHREDH